MTHHLSSTIKPLLGKKLLRFEINDPAKIFFTDGTEVTINITGDCCSTSIIYDVIQENNPQGTELIDVIEYDTSAAMPNAVEIAKKGWIEVFLWHTFTQHPKDEVEFSVIPTKY